MLQWQIEDLCIHGVRSPRIKLRLFCKLRDADNVCDSLRFFTLSFKGEQMTLVNLKCFAITGAPDITLQCWKAVYAVPPNGIQF